MLKNYLKIFFRSLLRNKLYFGLNFIGLIVGLTASLLLIIHVKGELGYDKFLPDTERIYRLRCDNLSGGEYTERMAVTNAPIAKAVKDACPEVESYVQLNNYYALGLFTTDLYNFRLKQAYFASEDFFKVFPYKLLQGNPVTALKDVNSVVLTESMAKKFFGTANALNRVIKYNNELPLKVTGVIKDVPENTHFKFSVLISYKTLVQYINPFLATDDAWISDETNYTYLKLKPGVDRVQLEQKIVNVVYSKIGSLLINKNQNKVFSLMSVTDIHLHSNFDNEMENNGSYEAILFFIIIALIIVLIALFNYINLSVAAGFKRFKEIGVRLANGATRREIGSQFLLETILVFFIASISSVMLVFMLAPYFSTYTGLSIDLSIVSEFRFGFVFLILVLAGAFISAIYPAFFLASAKPVEIIKGISKKGRSAFPVRKTLVGLQFIISVSLIIGTIIISKQVQFIQNEEPGFRKQQILVIKRPSVIDSTWMSKKTYFENRLLKIPEVNAFSFSRQSPGEQVNYTQGFVIQNGKEGNASVLMYNNFIDHRYADLYGLKFIAGTNFRETNQDLQMIINRRALKAFGFQKPEEAIGMQVFNEGWNRKHTIVGVIENYHQQSPKHDYEPMIFMHSEFPWLSEEYSVALKGTNTKKGVGEIEKLWKEVFTNDPFEFSFLDDKYNQQYQADIKFEAIFSVFSFLALLISGIGLFAITLYTISLRTKEIAIRKTIGASLHHIFILLSRDYIVISLIACLIAIPLMYWIMSGWLDNFAMRVSLSMWYFLLPVFVLFFLVIVSVAGLIFRSSRVNPVKYLRNE